ncbi:hypothetical protein SDC9_168926 [bioreactor metagenome]|uniref:Uncharacterized protein n=1 Tax=bioreactor metagenome TaxID=1076179 RepID=A0A645G5Z3_9ZZZZ
MLLHFPQQIGHGQYAVTVNSPIKEGMSDMYSSGSVSASASTPTGSAMAADVCSVCSAQYARLSSAASAVAIHALTDTITRTIKAIRQSRSIILNRFIRCLLIFVIA